MIFFQLFAFFLASTGHPISLERPGGLPVAVSVGSSRTGDAHKQRASGPVSIVACRLALLDGAGEPEEAVSLDLDDTSQTRSLVRSQDCTSVIFFVDGPPK